MIPLVTASEAGRAQIENRLPKRVVELQPRDMLSVCDPGISLLKQGITEGENPVFDLEFATYDACSSSRVVWDCSSKWVVSFI